MNRKASVSNIISLEKIQKSYSDNRFRKFIALEDVTLDVTQGEAFGFIGPNGAGKSTTIKILTGIITADSGKATMFDIPVTDHHSRRGMSYVPENPYLYDYLTPFEMLIMGCHMHGIKEDNLKSHCMKLLESFSIAHVANKKIRNFSKGMTQRTALAHALACKPRLLILDEPLSGLDPIGRKDVVDILLKYRNDGGTIFFSSHVLNDVQRLGDRFGIIHKGKLRAVNTPTEIFGEKESYFVIRTSGSSQLTGLEKENGNKWHVKVKEHELVEWLERLKSAQHTILDVQRGPTLEQVFLHFIKEIGGDATSHVS